MKASVNNLQIKRINMQNNNEITNLKITRNIGEAFFVGDICIRVAGFNPETFNILIDDKGAVAEYGKMLNVSGNIKIRLTKNTNNQAKCQIFAPKSVAIAREEIAQFDKNDRLIRVSK